MGSPFVYWKRNQCNNLIPKSAVSTDKTATKRIGTIPGINRRG
jgi:hypothetical protein